MQSEITGRTVLTAQDRGAVLRVVGKWLGWLTQGRMFWYSANLGLFAAVFALGGERADAIVLLAASAVCYAAAFVAARRTRAMLADGCLTGAESVFTVDDDGVSIHDEQGSLRVRWAHFESAFETPTLFLLRHHANAVALPKRAFSPSDLVAVRDAISSRMKLTPLKA